MRKLSIRINSIKKKLINETRDIEQKVTDQKFI